MDITDEAAVERVIGGAGVDKVVHCAAWTAVDAAEDKQELCRAVNAKGTENIAKMCKKLDLPMIYLSTDYVFDGQGTRPWEPDDPVVQPLNVYGQTTYDLAKLLVDMLEKEEYGKYHVTNEGGYISWCDFAKEIFRQAGMQVNVIPVSSAEYPAKAKRPSNSRMEKKKLDEHGFERLPSWQDALSRYLKEINR
jgi:dTDP-4-dehydrorhamnose reductase